MRSPATPVAARVVTEKSTLSSPYSEHGLVREHAALDALQRLGAPVSFERPEDVGAVEAERRVAPPARVDGRRDGLDWQSSTADAQAPFLSSVARDVLDDSL